MVNAAKKDGIILLGNSGYRSYKTQENTYNNRVKSQGEELTDAYVAKPGFSEHQTGLCIDLTNQGKNLVKGTKEAKWLADNCYRNDIFELTKMQNNTINLNKMHINLVELLGQVVVQFEYQFKNAHMKSRINFSEDKLIINADPGKLVRAFENLLSNAIKYGNDGFYVDVLTRLDSNIAVVQVINYGQSISPIDLPYIFDRFYRVEKSRNSNIGGSGLGLAITKNIIELHKGTISAYSDTEKTIFEVRLPVILIKI